MADQVKTDISDIVQVAQKQRRRQQMDLEKLERYGMLTPTGKNWLIQAVDPFHDSEIPHTGFPDLSCSSSVTQCIQVSGNIQCPSAITTGTWDCNIVAWPEVSNVATTTNKVGLSVRLPVPFVMTNSSTTTSAYPIGGVSAVSVASGGSTYGSTTTIYPTSVCSIPTAYMEGTLRVVAVGIEIINTTSPLNVQGMCTVYRMPTPSVNDMACLGLDVQTTATVPTDWVTVLQMPAPPKTITDAMLLQGTRQWHAREGAYLVQSFNDLDNPPTNPQSYAILAVDSENTVGYASTNTGMLGDTIFAYGATQCYGVHPQVISPLNVSGAYFTGLSLQTTLQVNYKVYVERFPTSFNPDLVIMASKSPEFDPFALQLYGMSLNSQPAGVMLKENPLGEWFQDILHEISANAEPILKGLSVVHPGFGVAGSIAGGIKNLTNRGGAPPASPSIALARAGRKAVSKKKKSKKAAGRPVASAGPAGS